MNSGWVLFGLAVAFCPAFARAQEVVVAATGDVMLARRVGRLVREDGPAAPFRFAGPLFAGADLVFGNLECALSAESVLDGGRFRFRADPACARALADAGFHAMSLANNHALDCGQAGLRDTQEALRQAGVAACGEERVVLRAKGLTVGILAFSDFPGPIGAERLRRSVSAAHQGVDALVVSVHWGVEGCFEPTPRQRRLALAVVEAGADLVVGHHPHVLQPIEAFRVGDRRALVAYSLGNFVFDARGTGAVLRCRIGRRGVIGFEAIPVDLRRGVPTPAGPLSMALAWMRLYGAPSTSATPNRTRTSATRSATPRAASAGCSACASAAPPSNLGSRASSTRRRPG